MARGGFFNFCCYTPTWHSGLAHDHRVAQTDCVKSARLEVMPLYLILRILAVKSFPYWRVAWPLINVSFRLARLFFKLHADYKPHLPPRRDPGPLTSPGMLVGSKPHRMSMLVE